jgi:hypothetical protein
MIKKMTLLTLALLISTNIQAKVERIGSIYDSINNSESTGVATCTNSKGETIQTRLSTVEYIIILQNNTGSNCTFVVDKSIFDGEWWVN